MKNIVQNKIQTTKDIFKSDILLVDFSDKIKNFDNEIRYFLKTKMYNNKKVLAKNNKNMKDAYDNYLVKIVDSRDKIAIRNAIEVIVNSPDFDNAIRNEFLIVGGDNLGQKLRLISNLALSGILNLDNICTPKSSLLSALLTS